MEHAKRIGYVLYFIVWYCIVSIDLYRASYSAHQSKALPVRETQRARIEQYVCIEYIKLLYSRILLPEIRTILCTFSKHNMLINVT